MSVLSPPLRSRGIPGAAERHPRPAATFGRISSPHCQAGPAANPASPLLAILVTDALAGAARVVEAARTAAAVAARRPVGLD